MSSVEAPRILLCRSNSLPSVAAGESRLPTLPKIPPLPSPVAAPAELPDSDLYSTAWQLRGQIRSAEPSARDARKLKPLAKARRVITAFSAFGNREVNHLEQLLLKDVSDSGPLRDFREGQMAALEALVVSLELSRSPAAVVGLLLKDVSLSGERVAPAVDAICASATLPPRGPVTNTRELFATVVRALQKESQVEVGDIVAQILWRHRNAESLQDRRFKKVAEKIEWALAEDPSAAPHLIEQVDGVFRELTTAAKGRMTSQMWRKVVAIIKANPILNERLRRSDVDRLYYGATHHRGQARSDGISRRTFKSLLVQLASCMEVPPYMVMLAVGSHNERAGLGAADFSDDQPQYMCKRLSDV